MKLHRQHLLDIYQAALTAVQGEGCTYNALGQLGLNGPVAVVAIGKAAASMMQGAMAALGEQIVEGLVITKVGHCGTLNHAAKNVICLEAGHPIPDEQSLASGQALLSFIDRQPESQQLVFLISGGSSSLVEVLPQGIDLGTLKKINDWLLGSGLDIAAMNQVRKSFSCIKAGRLVARLKGRSSTCLMISDVSGNLPHVIGSGLLFPDLDAEKRLPEIPAWILKLMEYLPPTPAWDDIGFKSVQGHVIATLNDARQAAAKAAHAMGYEVIMHDEMLSGDAASTGIYLARQLCESEPGLHIWGGETTVQLPSQPGWGGRNQQLALAAATLFSGRENCLLLAAGTDGSDGPTDDAGALVDGMTLARGSKYQLTAEQAMQHADAGSFLAASGDLIQTGPTGTNVMDLVLGLSTQV